MRFSLSIGQVLAIVGCVCLAVSAGAARKPKGESKPVVADDVVCDACIGPGEISPGTVGIPELDQGFLDLVDGGINDNATAINENDAAIQANSDAIASAAAPAGAFVKANGQTIGIFLQAQASGPPLQQSWLWVLSDTGYMFAVAPFSISPLTGRTGAAGELYQDFVRFDGPNCTGQAYSTALRPDKQAQFYSGYVFTSFDLNDPSPVYYSPTGSPVLTNVPVQSSRRDTGCISAVGIEVATVAILPNDPTITGVPSQRNLDAPITLGR